MRTIVGRILFTASLFFGTVALAQFTPIGDWLHNENIDLITDEDKSIIVAESSEYPGYAQYSGVVIRCADYLPLGVELYFNADRYLGSGDRYDVIYRIDGGQPISDRWSSSTDSEAAFAPLGAIEPLISSLLDSREMIFRVSTRTANYTYVVPTSGLREAISALGCYTGPL